MDIFQLAVFLIIGLFMIFLPIVMRMIRRTSAAANMLSAFEPIMSRTQVDKVKQNLEKIKAMTQDLSPMMSEQNISQLKGYMQLLSQVASETDKMMSTMAEMGISKDMILFNFPALASGLESMPEMIGDFQNMLEKIEENSEPFAESLALMDEFTGMVDTMVQNVNDFEQAKSLPIRALVPMFIVLGSIIMLLALINYFTI